MSKVGLYQEGYSRLKAKVMRKVRKTNQLFKTIMMHGQSYQTLHSGLTGQELSSLIIIDT